MTAPPCGVIISADKKTCEVNCMNLKEAFRYQNKLQSFIDEAQGILSREENITKVEKT